MVVQYTSNAFGKSLLQRILSRYTFLFRHGAKQKQNQCSYGHHALYILYNDDDAAIMQFVNQNLIAEIQWFTAGANVMHVIELNWL